ncbi:MAG: acetylornithine transaminase [Candidatus Nanopelagicales bacterium]
MTDWTERWQSALMDNYGTPNLLLVRGSGARVWDDAGTEYVDLVAGIAVNSLGHGDPRLVAAVTEQLSTLGHTSNLAATPPAIALAERLVGLVGDPTARVFFCNSGAEANEAAFKLTRLTGRGTVVVADRGFHGRTMGALALTAQPAKADPFRPLPGDVRVVPYGDAAALHEAVDESVAAVFLEPILGESGVVVPPAGYLAAARSAADAAGALLVLDEVQTGIGRTGAWFAHQHEGVRPDVVTLAKGLAGGLPIGACIGLGRAASLFTPGSHGSTFGGNPVSTRAALAVLDAIESDGLLDRAKVVGQRLADGIAARSGGAVVHVRGRGLMLAAVVGPPPAPRAPEIERAARANGLLVNAIGPDVIRFVPPLTLTDDDVEAALDRWEAACRAAATPAG